MELIADDIDLSEWMSEVEAHKLRPAGDWTEQVIDHFWAPVESKIVRLLPWPKTHKLFQIRPGETTIVAGINGHGKSEVLGQIVLDLCVQGDKVCVASLEMKPYRTMVRMAKQASGTSEPEVPFLKQLGRWTNGKLWLYDHVGMVAPEKMVALIRYAKATFDIDVFVVDNLTKVVPGEDNYNGQKDFINQITTLASDLNIHIIVVMHVRKQASEADVPNKMSLKGAGSIADMVDNIIIVWRNKEKERQLRDGNNAKVAEPDALLLIEKQRNAEGEESEATYLFWFDRMSHQYLEDRNGRLKTYNLVTI